MTGSCERDACGSARPEADAVRLFAAHCPETTEPRVARQGILSTDKDVINGRLATRTMGEFSFSFGRASAVARDRAHPRTGSELSSLRFTALADGRYGRGLDSGMVSVKLPLAKQEVCAARRVGMTRGFPGELRSTWLVALSGRRRGGGLATVLRIEEFLLSAPAGMDVRSGSGDGPLPDPKVNKAGTSCFMRTSGATSA